MNTSGHETESVASSSQTATHSSEAPNLKGPIIFVYIASILMGLAAGVYIALICWTPDELFDWPDIMGYIGLVAGILGGVIAARFWIKQMTRHVHKNTSPRKLFLWGILLGLAAGWFGSVILWLFEWFAVFFFVKVHDWALLAISTLVGIGFFGSISGLWAGLICSGVWVIRYQKQNTHDVC